MAKKDFDPALLRRMMLGDFSSQFSEDKSPKKLKSKTKTSVIDLHFNKLYPNKTVKPTEILQLQLYALDDFISECVSQDIRAAYVIVGKGEGILKKSCETRLLNHSKILKIATCYDPPYFGNALKLYF